MTLVGLLLLDSSCNRTHVAQFALLLVLSYVAMFVIVFCCCLFCICCNSAQRLSVRGPGQPGVGPDKHQLSTNSVCVCVFIVTDFHCHLSIN